VLQQLSRSVTTLTLPTLGHFNSIRSFRDPVHGTMELMQARAGGEQVGAWVSEFSGVGVHAGEHLRVRHGRTMGNSSQERFPKLTEPSTSVSHRFTPSGVWLERNEVGAPGESQVYPAPPSRQIESKGSGGLQMAWHTSLEYFEADLMVGDRDPHGQTGAVKHSFACPCPP
jgi:hypothetical protein